MYLVYLSDLEDRLESEEPKDRILDEELQMLLEEYKDLTPEELPHLPPRRIAGQRLHLTLNITFRSSSHFCAQNRRYVEDVSGLSRAQQSHHEE